MHANSRYFNILKSKKNLRYTQLLPSGFLNSLPLSTPFMDSSRAEGAFNSRGSMLTAGTLSANRVL